MGQRGPKPIGEKAINPNNYYRPAIGPVTNDEQRRAAKWFNSFNAVQRAELLAVLYELWQEQQIVILDMMAGN